MINSLIGGFALDNDRQKLLDTVIKIWKNHSVKVPL